MDPNTGHVGVYKSEEDAKKHGHTVMVDAKDLKMVLEMTPDQRIAWAKRLNMTDEQKAVLVAVEHDRDRAELLDALNRISANTDGLFVSLGVDGGRAHDLKRALESLVGDGSGIDVNKTVRAMAPSLTVPNLATFNAANAPHPSGLNRDARRKLKSKGYRKQIGKTQRQLDAERAKAERLAKENA